jgi:hypothetical protein
MCSFLTRTTLVRSQPAVRKEEGGQNDGYPTGPLIEESQCFICTLINLDGAFLLMFTSRAALWAVRWGSNCSRRHPVGLQLSRCLSRRSLASNRRRQLGSARDYRRLLTVAVSITWFDLTPDVFTQQYYSPYAFRCGSCLRPHLAYMSLEFMPCGHHHLTSLG